MAASGQAVQGFFIKKSPGEMEFNPNLFQSRREWQRLGRAHNPKGGLRNFGVLGRNMQDQVGTRGESSVPSDHPNDL